MKILVYALNFSPELTGIGKFVGEMVEWLSGAGHEVRVVTAPPYYPGWRVEAGYSGARYKRETGGGVRVLRCPIWVPADPTARKRVLHLSSFALSSAAPLLALSAAWRPDVVWTVMPPSFGLPAAILAARLAGARSWLHVQDFEIDAAFDLDLVRGQRFQALAVGAERRLIRSFDVVSSITSGMVERLTMKTAGKVRGVNFPNWVDAERIFPLQGKNRLRAEWGIPDDCVVALYSGNLGAKQGIELLVAVAQILAESPDIQLVVSGDGAAKTRLALLAEGLANFRLVPLQPRENLNELLNAADVHLLPQRAAAAELVMPSKLGGMLASGRPVIAGALPDTALGREIAGCGIAVHPENARAMATALMALARAPELRRQLGRAARLRALERWEKNAIMSRFEQDLLALVARRSRPRRGAERGEAL